MKTIIAIFLFLFFTKGLLFWLWLWQLKEYHCGRMKAHFERQLIRKLFATLTRLQYPKFTKKALVILLTGLLLEILVLAWLTTLPANFFYIAIIILIITAPIAFSLLVLAFQIPTVIWIRHILRKAKQKREQFKNLIVIGITGSYGKTSTKEFLATILSQKFKVLKTEKHINAEIGIAQTILQKLNPEHQIFIAEIGAYNRGKIRQVCKMLQPKIGILTGINEQHMSTFGSQENITKAKYELIEALPKDGLAIFNGNNKYCQELYQKTKISKKITKLQNDNKYSTIVRNLLPWGVENFVMAAAVAEKLGMGPEEIIKVGAKIRKSLQIKKGISGLNIIDSTYSANPNSVIAHLDYWKTQPGKKIIIMPCLIELGKAAKAVHQKIGERITQVCDLAIITTRDYFPEIKKAAQKSGMPLENILLMENPEQILEKIKTFARAGDTILLESRVPQELVKKLMP